MTSRSWMSGRRATGGHRTAEEPPVPYRFGQGSNGRTPTFCDASSLLARMAAFTSLSLNGSARTLPVLLPGLLRHRLHLVHRLGEPLVQHLQRFAVRALDEI